MEILEKIKTLDHGVHAWVLNNQNPVAVYFFKIFTGLGSGYFWLCVYLTSFTLGTAKIRFIVFTIITAELLGLLLIIILRNYFPRKRPGQSLKFIVPFPWNMKSFPSQHALRSGILATIGAIHFPAATLTIIGVAVLVSLSRIYLQWHYVSDVLTGFLIGISCILCASNILVKLF